jgi:TM2 domain-containing membrane protein YozV
MTARTFGRKGSEDAEMASRREAFLASERARREQPSLERPETARSPEVASRPIFVREKSVGVAYLLWFFFGALSAHRFYLGYSSSAAAQAGLWFVSWMMIAAGFLLAGFGLVIAAIWMIGDAFVIPSLCRGANERARQNATAFAFA